MFKKYKILIFIIFVLLFFSSILFSLSAKKITNYVPSGIAHPTPKTTASTFNLLLPAFYPKLSWSNGQYVSLQSSRYKLMYSKNNNSREILLYGKEWEAKMENLNLENLLKAEDDFRNYYNNLMGRNGWGTGIVLDNYTLDPESIS